MPLVHLLRLLGTCLAVLPSRIGSNWGGVVFSLILFGLAEALLWGRAEMTRAVFIKNTLVSILAVVMAWLGLGIVSVCLTIYDDHKNLAGAAARIRHAGDARQAKLTQELHSAEWVSHEQNQGCKTLYARLEGISDTLQKQNRDQQGTINNCQTQALKLLLPPMPWIKTFAIFHDHDGQMPSAEYILTTNVVRSPVDLVATCDFPIGNTTLHILTESGATEELGNLRHQMSATQMELRLSTPAWDVASPAKVTIFFSGTVNKNPVCTFVNR